MCSLKATAMCCEAERRAQSLQQARSFDPSIPSGHLSVNKIHREQKDRLRWHMHSVYRKPVMACKVTGGQHGPVEKHQTDKQVGRRTQSAPGAVRDVPLGGETDGQRRQTGRVTDSMGITGRWTGAWWYGRSKLRH